MHSNNASRSWPVCQAIRPAELALLLMGLLLIGGCSTAPDQPERPRPVPVDVELTPAKPEPGPQPRAPAPATTACDWSKIRGVAEVVAPAGSEPEFRFYPGNIALPVSAGQEVRGGQEYKAILKQARDCPPQLQLIDKVS